MRDGVMPPRKLEKSKSSRGEMLMRGWVMHPGKQEKASYPEVQGNAPSAMPRRQVAATKRGQAPPHIRSSAGRCNGSCYPAFTPSSRYIFVATPVVISR